MEKVYTTLDAYQTGFLTLKGHSPKLIPQDDKIVFLFEATDAFYRDLAEYNGGALVNASKFAMTIKALKSQIIGLKMNKGKSYVERKEKGE
jgi:hypothetical protein